MKRTTFVVLIIITLVLVSCRTTMESHKMSSGVARQNGLPYYLPRHLLLVREPIEVERSETLYALLSLGGVHHYVYELPSQNMPQAINDLKALINLAPGDNVELVPSDQQLTVLVETSSKGSTKSNQEESEKTSGKDSQKDEQSEENEKSSSKSNVSKDVSKEEADESAKTSSEEESHEESQKFELIPAPNKILGESEVFHEAADPAKSYEIISVPDQQQQYELVLKPSLFASSKINLTFGDGWRLEGFSAETGENQLVDAFASLAETVIGARKETQLAEIGKDQAIELAQLEHAATAAGAVGVPQAALVDDKVTKVELRVEGYIKSISLSVVEPGVYDLQTLAAGGLFRTKSVTFWQRVHF